MRQHWFVLSRLCHFLYALHAPWGHILAVCIISPWQRGDAISHVIEYGAREYASVSLSMSIYLSAPRHLWILMSRTSSAVIQNMFIFVITNLRLVGGRRSREPLHVHRINKFVCATLNPRACVCWKIGRQGRKCGACRRRRQNIRRRESKKGCVGPGPARERYVGWVCVCWSQDREKIVSLRISRDSVCITTTGQMGTALYLWISHSLLISHHATLICYWYECGNQTQRNLIRLDFSIFI